MEQLFILDWEWAMRKNVDSILWESYKRLLDMKKETIDWCIGGLCELFVLVLHNEIKQTGPLPPVIIACQSLSTVQCAFAAFIYIRLGDLFRYKVGLFFRRLNLVVEAMFFFHRSNLFVEAIFFSFFLHRSSLVVEAMATIDVFI